jgi:photosystem II stability/assembly factor-like uncharacterized protein
LNRFERVVEILDAAVGGPTAPVNFHGAFWRGVSRNDFVARKVYGFDLITLGDGAGSTIVKALRGETPFGADTGNPNADFNRMPSGRPLVPFADIAFIENWIDDGCPEDPLPAVVPQAWRKTNAPVASSRTDDIWFVDERTGWAVNSDGNIIHTADGGDSWTVQHSTPSVYLRCVAFANPKVGWVGTLSRRQRLLRTADGGATWVAVTNLPANAPVAICGLAVVNENVVYGSGTNRPEDFPLLVKTTDGGATWTAIDMSSHASILIDVFFRDAMHGWVVGGKASQPTPTTRDKLKPVVLETTDGGATWVNRLVGQEASFPFGEWGWKIQFLNDKVGFVSLENFSDGAILKTTDGGKIWTRIKINDPQGNKNLEGVGFIDEKTGWVGGWGPGGFGQPGEPQGFSSATNDGGATWRNANEIGLRINRFRFFGSPVKTGYASGFTVYKYASTPALFAIASAPRSLLPDARIDAGSLPVSVPMDVPAGTKRLTLRAWDWFGVELGTILDEVRPVSGSRFFQWDGLDARGNAIGFGDCIVRMTADDLSASSIIGYRRQAASLAMATAPAAPRIPAFTRPSSGKHRTLAALMKDPTHDLAWLRNALQLAIELELATLPPYLVARWTIKPPATGDPPNPVAESIRVVRSEEMSHMAVACNLLVAIDGTPLLADSGIVPKYPGPLPGGVSPNLTVALRKLTKEQAKVFMDIEYPEGGPIAVTAAETFATIGTFYNAILDAFRNLNPTLSIARQLEMNGSISFKKVDTIAKVEEAIGLILLQGEGSQRTPEEECGDLAHYYRFGEIYHGKTLKKDATSGKWTYSTPDIALPETYDMADIPDGGYKLADVPDPTTWDLIVRFDQEYSKMLRNLQDAWTHGETREIWMAVTAMLSMSKIGNTLVQTPRPDGNGNYGPCFRFVE